MKLETSFKIAPKNSLRSGKQKPRPQGVPHGTRAEPPINKFKKRQWNIQKRPTVLFERTHTLQLESRSVWECSSAFLLPVENLPKKKISLYSNRAREILRWIS